MQLSRVFGRVEGSQPNDGSAEDEPGIRCHPPNGISIGSDHEVVVRWPLNGGCGAVGAHSISARDVHRLHIAVQTYGKGGVSVSLPVVGDLSDRRDWAETHNGAPSRDRISPMKGCI